MQQGDEKTPLVVTTEQLNSILKEFDKLSRNKPEYTVLTLKEVCEFLKMGERELYDRIKEGKLKPLTDMRKFRFTLSELHRYIDEAKYMPKIIRKI